MSSYKLVGQFVHLVVGGFDLSLKDGFLLDTHKCEDIFPSAFFPE